MNRRDFLIKDSSFLAFGSLSQFAESSESLHTDFLCCAIVDNSDIKAHEKYGAFDGSTLGDNHTFYYIRAESTKNDGVFYHCGDMEVFLDGCILQHCVTADVMEGWAEVFKLDESGRPEYILADYQVKNPPGSSEDKYYNIMIPKTYRLHGAIQILKKAQL